MDIQFQQFNSASVVSFYRSPEAFKAHCRRFYSQKLKTDGFAPPPSQPSVAVGKVAPYYEKLNIQAYRLYLCLRDQSRSPRTFSVRRERCAHLADRAFDRYQRRVGIGF